MLNEHLIILRNMPIDKPLSLYQLSQLSLSLNKGTRHEQLIKIDQKLMERLVESKVVEKIRSESRLYWLYRKLSPKELLENIENQNKKYR